MSDYSAVRDAIATLPEELQANATDLLDRMEATIEGIGDRERSWTPPFLKLIQPTTGEIPEGAGLGSLCINTEVLTKKKGESVTLIPLRVWDSRQMWDEDPSNSQQLCNSPDAKQGYTYGKCWGCDFAKWVEGKGSACRKSKSFLAITSDLSQVVQLQFSKAQYKYGTDWENMLKKAGVSIYRRAYDLSTEKNAKNPAYHMKAEPSSEKPADKTLDFLKALFDIEGVKRKEMLERFYESVANREAKKGGDHIASDAGGADEEVDLGGDGQVDESAKGYSL